MSRIAQGFCIIKSCQRLPLKIGVFKKKPAVAVSVGSSNRQFYFRHAVRGIDLSP